MAGNATAGLHPHLAGNKIELVVEYDNVGKIELVETNGFADRATGLVHVGLRLEQYHLLAPELAFGGDAFEALAPSREGMSRGDNIDRHEPHIVPVEGVFSARIAEADKELHLFILTENERSESEGKKVSPSSWTLSPSPSPSPSLSPSLGRSRPERRPPPHQARQRRLRRRQQALRPSGRQWWPR